MTPIDPTSATSILPALGLGKYAAGIVSIFLAGIAILTHVMPWLPVASASSAPWYRSAYGVAAWLTGAYGAAAPTPVNGQPAGGIVPAPPKAVATPATTIPASMAP
jgi:hypothetical protein